MGECQIDVTVDASSMRELHTFRNLFTVKFGNYLKERYAACIGLIIEFPAMATFRFADISGILYLRCVPGRYMI